MKRLLLTILPVFILCFLAIGCGLQKRVSSTPTLDKIQKRGTLLVGTTGDYRRSLGVSISYVPTSWPTLSADVQKAELFDFAIGGITITDVRLETMDMSEGYLCNGKTILCRREDVSKYKTLKDLNKPDVRVMVNPGGLNETFARENLPLCTLIVYGKNEDIPDQIAEGEADVMITEITEAPWYVNNDTRLSAPLLDQPFNRGQIGVLMRKGQDDLLKKVNEIIREMKSNGKLKSLHDKYGLIYGY